METKIDILNGGTEYTAIAKTIHEVWSYSGASSHKLTSCEGTFSPHSHSIGYWASKVAAPEAVWTIFEKTNEILNSLDSDIQHLNSKLQMLEDDIYCLNRQLSQQKEFLEMLADMCKKNAAFAPQFSSLIAVIEDHMKQQEELAAQSEVQYQSIKKQMEKFTK